ncbi:MAG: methyltransferase [Synechococcales cyanobacterium M58_A2018_015]|nr:methyltransferase [Synechococcales cyanobacterium M58_A2018_015]
MTIHPVSEQANIPPSHLAAVGTHSPKDVFFCPEESHFYAQCIEKMVVSQCQPSDVVIEFGAGDGSPVIHCLLKSRFDAMIHGYELNAAACELAQSRIQHYGLQHQYAVHNQCFFSHFPATANYLIANPPYLPAPDSNLYLPALHGGTDGATITKRLLSLGCENLMLMISAYSNPVETVEHALQQGYRVADFAVSPLRFGYYSCEPKVKRTIAKLREHYKAFYSANIYFLAGVLFKRQSDINLATELLKVMTVL